MTDFKHELQLRAEELADQQTGRDFYELSNDQQDRIYRQAEDDYWDAMAGRAEYLEDR